MSRSAYADEPVGCSCSSGRRQRRRRGASRGRDPRRRSGDRSLEPLTDDWPFVYLRERAVPTDYLVTGLLVLVLIAASLLALRTQRKRGGQGAQPIHRARVRPVFFALGAGFLLLETRGLAVFGVLAGNTWQNASAVFVGVLVMALASTAIAAKVRAAHARFASRAAFVFLFAALATGWLLPVASLGGLSRPVAIAAAGLLVALPVLASGIVFALELRREGDADAAIASNLVGALVGGLTEYASMVVGMRALLLLAGAYYAVAWVWAEAASWSRDRASTPDGT